MTAITTKVRALGLATALLAALPLAAQDWTFAITGAWVEQSSDGSDGSFRTQLNLDEGFLLEDLHLAYDGGDEKPREFDFSAWGLGSAEPSQGAKLAWKPAGDWKVEVDYWRTESFFQLAETELGLRQDDWRVTRLGSKITWSGWKPAKLSLGLRRVDRSGLITQPFLELNEVYLLGADLDETREEATLRLETRTLPVKLIFEQSFGRLERRNNWFPASTVSLDGDDPDILLDAANERRETRDLPVSRLAATWAGDRVEVTGAFLYSPADLDIVGESSTTFGIDGGRVGRIEFADDLLGSGSFDAAVGHLGVGIRLAPRWTLRLRGEYRDRAQDVTLLGGRILRLSNDQGEIGDIVDPFDEDNFFDTTDTETRVEVEHERDNWTVWAGFFDAAREVDYRRRSDEGPVGVERDSEGFLAGVAVHLGRRLKASLEYEHGTFERFVFRIDPETVDRLTAKLKTQLPKGWQANLRARFEEADNPVSVSSLDRSSDTFGVGLYKSSEDGKRDVGFDFDLIDLTAETGIVFPGGAPGLSRYDLSLVSVAAHGRAEHGKLKLSASLQWLEDDGDTWPLASWNAKARIAFATTDSTEIAVFGQRWSYDEDLGQNDDFEVTRYGVAFAWRYE